MFPPLVITGQMNERGELGDALHNIAWFSDAPRAYPRSYADRDARPRWMHAAADLRSEYTHCWHQRCEQARCAHLAAEAAPS